MSTSQTIALGLALVALSVLANLYGSYRTINDESDIGIYYERGSWVLGGRQPYRDVFSEYPQISTWFFGLPHLAAEAWARATGAEVEGHRPYRYAFTAFMAILLALTIQRVHALRQDRRWLAFLLLMPAGWYFTHNRFDIMPALLTLLALDSLRRSRPLLAFAMLALATMTKWYAVVMIPVFTIHLWQVQRRIVVPALATYGAVVVLVILPTLLAIGLDGFLIPYRFHLGRAMNEESLLYLVMRTGLLNGVPQPALFTLFLIGQLAMIPLCLRARVDTWERVVRWSALSVLCFMLFAKFYSPQWIIWVSPMLILLVRQPIEVAGLVAFDLVTYVYFPQLYDRQTNHPLLFELIIVVKTLVVAGWMGYLLWRPDCTALAAGARSQSAA